MSTIEQIGKAVEFAGPLLGEVVGLVGRWIAADKEGKEALELRKVAAIAEMKGARADEAARHAAETAETQRVINDAAQSLP